VAVLLSSFWRSLPSFPCQDPVRFFPIFAHRDISFFLEFSVNTALPHQFVKTNLQQQIFRLFPHAFSLLVALAASSPS